MHALNVLTISDMMIKNSYCIVSERTCVMKKGKRRIALALALMLAFATGVYASGAVQNITAQLCPDVKVYLDGQSQTFKDANGQIVYPIIYNGSTYLPIRAIGGLMDKSVGWDGAKREVYLGEKPVAPDTTPSSSGTNTDSVAKDNIKVDSSIAKDGSVVAILTNNNSQSIAKVEVNITFYDSDGKMIGVDKEPFYALNSKATVACALECRDSNYKPIKFNKYEIELKVDKGDNSYKGYYDKISIQDSMSGGKVIAKFTNNASEEIDSLEAVTVFYEGGELVGASYEGTAIDVKSNETISKEFTPPTDENYHGYEFDSYKVYVTEAYSYNW